MSGRPAHVVDNPDPFRDHPSGRVGAVEEVAALVLSLAWDVDGAAGPGRGSAGPSRG